METWQLLRDLNNKYNIPWVCTRDFNEILRGHEKLGGSPRRDAEMEAFRDVVDELGFVDLGYTSKKFTWRGKRGETMILERLDRAFASPLWLELSQQLGATLTLQCFRPQPHNHQTRRYCVLHQ